MTDFEPLKMETSSKGRYHIIRILDEDVGQRGDLSDLIEAIRICLAGDIKDIAVVFSASTLLYSRSIAALVRCYAMIDDVDGTIVLVAPNPHLRRAIEIAGINTIIKTVASEQEIPA
jgi:anti-anti-sigma factor